MPGFYQPPPEGIWRSTPEHVLRWAVTGALHRITREMPERKKRAAFERKLERALLAPVKKQKWQQLYKVAKADEPENEPKLQVPDQVMRDWEETIGALITGSQGIWQVAAETRTAAEDLPFDPHDLEDAIQDSVKLVKSIPETAHDRLRSIMRQAYKDQTHQAGFAKQIRQEFAAVSKRKAEQIAVTEWNRAASAATWLGYQKQGVQSKIWYTAGDDRVCPECELNGAEFEIPINQAFPSGDQYPPAHPGCRCDISGA